MKYEPNPAAVRMADRHAKYAAIAVMVAIFSCGICTGICIYRLDRNECEAPYLSDWSMIQSTPWPESLDQRDVWPMDPPVLRESRR